MSITTIAKQVVLFSVALALVIICTSILFGQDKDHSPKQRDFCSGSNNWNSDNRSSVSDLRELSLAANSTLNVDAGKNGGISIKGENRSDILVRACVQSWAKTDEAARSIVSGIRITTNGEVKAEGPDDSNWSVSYEILVPRATDLSLTAHNGGIAISSVDGKLEFETMNGGVNVTDISGDVKGRTTNGGVNVRLSGSSWKGSGLDLQTSNGGVNISIPENYAANIETGTTNGGYKSNIAALSITTEDKRRGGRINTAINGGGAPIKIITTNGGVRINTTEY